MSEKRERIELRTCPICGQPYGTYPHGAGQIPEPEPKLEGET